MTLNECVQHLIDRARAEVAELGIALPRAAIINQADEVQHMQLGLPPAPSDPEEQGEWFARQCDTRMRIAAAVASTDPRDTDQVVMSCMVPAGHIGEPGVLIMIVLPLLAPRQMFLPIDPGPPARLLDPVTLSTEVDPCAAN